MQYFWYVVAGIVSGVVAGMGMGGGTLLIPILTIFFEVEQASAQGINLLAFLPCAVVSLVIHFKNHLVSIKKGIPFIIGGVLCSVLGSLLATKISSDLLQLLFGIFLLIIGIIQIISSINQKFFAKKPKSAINYEVIVGTVRDITDRKNPRE